MRRLRWADAMTAAFAHVPPRSLHGYRTAYPRTSKLGTDPGNGLASIEALRGKGPQEVLDGLLRDVRAFCADATQSDDVTIVMVR